MFSGGIKREHWEEMGLMYVAIKIAVVHGCKNIHLICLISVAVTYNHYHSQSDRLSC